MFDYPLLEALYAVEKAGNFESVARSHGVSKSAISQNLRLLEERMGAATVCRDAIMPTHFGFQLCRHLEHIKLLENKFLADNANMFSNVDLSSIAVTIAVNDECLSNWLREALIDAHRLFKHFYLDIEVTSENVMLETLRSGKCLASITTKREPIDGFDCYPLGQHRYHAIASLEFFKRNFSSGVTKESLEKATTLKYAKCDDLSGRWALSATGSKISCANNTHTLQSSQGIVEACLHDKAWAVTSSLLVSRYLSSGQLVELLPGRVLKEDLFWQINQRVSDPLADLTKAIRNAADLSLFQSNKQHV